jgi:hypothetical protein
VSSRVRLLTHHTLSVQVHRSKEGRDAKAEMTLGLLRVASILLVKLAAASGQAEQEILQEMALKYRG